MGDQAWEQGVALAKHWNEGGTQELKMQGAGDRKAWIQIWWLFQTPLMPSTTD